MMAPVRRPAAGQLLLLLLPSPMAKPMALFATLILFAAMHAMTKMMATSNCSHSTGQLLLLRNTLFRHPPTQHLSSVRYSPCS